jgi:hypothetical protein
MQLSVMNLSSVFNGTTHDVIEVYLIDPAAAIPTEDVMKPVHSLTIPPANPTSYGAVVVPWAVGTPNGDRVTFYVATNINGTGPTNVTSHTQTSTVGQVRLRDDGSGGYTWQFAS